MSDICPGYISLLVCQGDPFLRPILTFIRVPDIVSFREFFPEDSTYANTSSLVTVEGRDAIVQYFVEDTIDSIAKKIMESKYCEQFGLQRVDLK